MKIGYRGQILVISAIVFGVILAILAQVTSSESQYCEQLVRCLRVVAYGAPYQYFFYLLTAILLTLIPLFFLKESIYRTWRKFTLIYLPIAALLIYLSPEPVGGGFISVGLTREIVSFWLALLFIFISFLIMIGVFEKQNVKKQIQ